MVGQRFPRQWPLKHSYTADFCLWKFPNREIIHINCQYKISNNCNDMKEQYSVIKIQLKCAIYKELSSLQAYPELQKWGEGVWGCNQNFFGEFPSNSHKWAEIPLSKNFIMFLGKSRDHSLEKWGSGPTPYSPLGTPLAKFFR